ncbi:hypothetical protein L5G28_17000 [Gordonia sp. HY285]|uniref:hypothetical protein n=1 Tax=Gordonia liuliyuniae TaxID=2911517 RepID=UPI001F2D1ECC|nr:hypothetical protein [Gordonia liuliyuniae]MCF8611846.1 hypothetical protein [Gordonia liuliyuniae]
MTYSSKDVHRVTQTADLNSRDFVPLGFVANDGTYRFPDGTRLPASGGITYPDGRHVNGTAQVIVGRDGRLNIGGYLRDASDPAADEANGRHHVDGALQDEYDSTQNRTKA